MEAKTLTTSESIGNVNNESSETMKGGNKYSLYETLGVWGFGIAIVALLSVIFMFIWYAVDKNTVQSRGIKKEIIVLDPSQTSVTPDGHDIISASCSELRINKPDFNKVKGLVFTISNTGDSDMLVSGGSGDVTLLQGPATIEQGKSSKFIYTKDSPPTLFRINY